MRQELAEFATMMGLLVGAAVSVIGELAVPVFAFSDYMVWLDDPGSAWYPPFLSVGPALGLAWYCSQGGRWFWWFGTLSCCSLAACCSLVGLGTCLVKCRPLKLWAGRCCTVACLVGSCWQDLCTVSSGWAGLEMGVNDACEAD